MLGETSLLKEGRATAAVVADTDTTVIAIEGRALEQVRGLRDTIWRGSDGFMCSDAG
jgi:CRP-like cAMP-binding protein